MIFELKTVPLVMLLRHQRYLSTSARLAQRISAAEFRDRRAQLVESIILSVNENSASSLKSPLIIASSQNQTYNAPDVPHVFRQCSNFRYLTGFEDVDKARLLLDANHSILFVNERTEQETLWHGRILPSSDLCRDSGVEEVLPFSEFGKYLSSVVRANTVLAIDSAQFKHHFVNESNKDFMLLLQNIPSRVNLLPYMNQLRWIKSASECEIMRKTCRIGADTINATIANALSHTNESHLVGLLEYEARRRGAQFLAYPPVVAGGANANTIHYISSKENIDPAACVLVDAGCDVDGYVSDITRCFPISAKFSREQRDLYDSLSHLHEDLLDYVAEIRPLRLNELYLHMLKRMGEILTSINFFQKPLSGDELMLECDKLCPHHVSHYLGLDVHDSPTVARNIPIPPGVIITVEPGIYVRSDNKMVRTEFHGMGFRLEDDILITDTGSENLTDRCVRNSDDIEILMHSSI